MSDYKTRLQQSYGTLSNGLQKVGDYLVMRPESFAMKSAAEVGQEVGLSETTVIRFAYALKYSGYSEMQRNIREYIFDFKSSLEAYQYGKQGISGEHLFERVMNQDRENILLTARNIDERDFHWAVDRLSNAEQILSAGVRSSYAMAHWFTFVMDIIRGNTRLFQPGVDDVILRVSEMDEKGVFVAFSFHRYALETIRLAEQMQARGTFVIGVTDSPVAPIAACSNIVFPVQLATQSTLDTVPVCFSLLNALVSAVSLNYPDRFEQRSREYETNHLTGFFK